MKILYTQEDLVRIEEYSLPKNCKYSNSRKKAVKKRKRKSNEQLSLLLKVFQSSFEWDKDTLALLSKQTGLTEAQIYKWSWDQKKKIQIQDKIKVKTSLHLSELFGFLPSSPICVSNKNPDLCIDTKELGCSEVMSMRSIDYDMYFIQKRYRRSSESLNKGQDFNLEEIGFFNN